MAFACCVNLWWVCTRAAPKENPNPNPNPNPNSHDHCFLSKWKCTVRVRIFIGATRQTPCRKRVYPVRMSARIIVHDCCIHGTAQNNSDNVASYLPVDREEERTGAHRSFGTMVTNHNSRTLVICNKVFSLIEWSVRKVTIKVKSELIYSPLNNNL